MTEPKNFDCIAYAREQRAYINAKIEELGWDGFFDWLEEWAKSDPEWQRFASRVPVAQVPEPRKGIAQSASAGNARDALP